MRLSINSEAAGRVYFLVDWSNFLLTGLCCYAKLDRREK